MDNVFTIIIVDLIIATTILIPVMLVSHCLHNRARIYEEKTGKKPWYGGGLMRIIFGDRTGNTAGYPRNSIRYLLNDIQMTATGRQQTSNFGGLEVSKRPRADI